MGIEEIRKLKEKKGSVMTADEAKALFKGGSQNPMAGKFHSGNYECSKGSVYFRSQWEANYALYLDWLIKQGQIKDWQFEPDILFFGKIKHGTNNYKPDFKVFNKDGSFEYHEVKGYLDAKSKTKLKRMAKYFPDTKLELIDGKRYQEIIKRMKGLIKFYS